MVVSKGEVALLVLQFLKEEQCNTSYEIFKNECKHLLAGLDTVQENKFISIGSY